MGGSEGSEGRQTVRVMTGNEAAGEEATGARTGLGGGAKETKETKRRE